MASESCEKERTQPVTRMTPDTLRCPIKIPVTRVRAALPVYA